MAGKHRTRDIGREAQDASVRTFVSLRSNLNRSLARATGFEIRRARPGSATAVTKPVPPVSKQKISGNGPNPAKQPVPKPHAAQLSSAPGERRLASNFFDRYRIFYETSETAPMPGRLNLRYDAIFEQNREVFAGARVLDIASHDGRWSLAALETGAAHVTGVEPHAELVANAESTMSKYVDDASRYRFIKGDIFKVLKTEQFQVDIVMCLGFLYHTLRYNELFAGIRRLNPKYVIIDTTIFHESQRRVVKLDLDATVVQRDAVRDEYSHGQFVLVGSPTLSGLEMMLNAYDFKIERLSDWAGLIRDNPEAEGVRRDYGIGRRVTLLAYSGTVAPRDLPLRRYVTRIVT